MKINNLKITLKKHRKNLIIIFGSIAIFMSTVTVVNNSKTIIRALSFKDKKSVQGSKHTPQQLQWVDTFKGVNNMNTKNN